MTPLGRIEPDASLSHCIIVVFLLECNFPFSSQNFIFTIYLLLAKVQLTGSLEFLTIFKSNYYLCIYLPTYMYSSTFNFCIYVYIYMPLHICYVLYVIKFHILIYLYMAMRSI